MEISSHEKTDLLIHRFSKGSTWAVVRVISQEKAVTGKFVLHTVQLAPGKSVMNNNHEKMFSLSDLGEWSYGLSVQGMIMVDSTLY